MNIEEKYIRGSLYLPCARRKCDSFQSLITMQGCRARAFEQNGSVSGSDITATSGVEPRFHVAAESAWAVGPIWRRSRARNCRDFLYFHLEVNSSWLMMRKLLLQLAPGVRFPKVPKSFRTRKAITKISNLKFTDLFFSHIFNMNKVVLHAKFYAYTLLCFQDTGN